MTTRRSPKCSRFFSIADVAELVGVNARTVRRWIKSRELVAYRIRGILRISEPDLTQFLEIHRDK
jgi:excisionase family DNA binding protein